MTFNRLRKINKNQKGFTLVEMLIAVAITGIIGWGIARVIYQVVDVNTRSVAHMSVVKQVENAVHWITRDSLVAQNVAATAPTGFPLTLNSVDWNNTAKIVTYSVQNGQLQRSYSVNGGQPSKTILISNLNTNSQMTNCQFSSGALDFKITATIYGLRPASETRSFEIIPRSIP